MVKSKTKISKQTEKKGNPILVETIRSAKKTNTEFWLKIASILSGPRRMQRIVSLDDLDKNAKEGDSIVIPGKVLSQGELNKKIAVIAFNFSEKAKEKILKTKSRCINIFEEIKKNPNANGLRMIGE